MADHRLGARESELGWAPRAAMPMAEWISAKVRGRAQVCVLRTHAFFHGARPAPAWPRLHKWLAIALTHGRGAVRRVKTPQSPKKWRSRRDG